MKSRTLLVLLLLVLPAAVDCEAVSGPAPSGPDVGARSETGSGMGRAREILECSPSSAAPLKDGSQVMEIQGNPESAQLWALVFERLPLHADREVKFVWRMIGSGPLELSAVGPDGMLLFPKQGPRKHSDSGWDKPGDEWGSTFIFPKGGCWQIMDTRGTKTGEIAFMVQGAGESSARADYSSFFLEDSIHQTPALRGCCTGSTGRAL